MDRKLNPAFYSVITGKKMPIPFHVIPQTLFPNPNVSKEKDADFPRCVDVATLTKKKISDRQALIIESDILVPDIIVTHLRKHNKILLDAFLDLKSTKIEYLWEEYEGGDSFSIKKNGPTIEESCM